METQMHMLAKQFNECAREARAEGYILKGSVVRRHLVRGRGEEEKRYGPYYLWTRKEGGKTVTVALDKAQALAIRDAITRLRQLDRQLAKLRALSERILFLVSDGVPRRNRQKKVV
jgi:hypothetical protein